MCDACNRIEHGGKTPKDMLDQGLMLQGLTKYDEPIFADCGGGRWVIVQDPLHESTWFVPARENE